MSVELHFNHRRTDAARGRSLFDIADDLGLKVPTSCRKQGRCKECVVEVTDGMEHLSSRAPDEGHLRDGFRLACCCRIGAESGVIRCHTMRRGEMRIENRALNLPRLGQRPQLDPAVTRDGDRVLLDGVEIDRTAGPLHGLAMDLGTTTVVLRLLNMETGEVIATSSFENPQRFGGSDVMARIQFDTDNPAGLLHKTLAGYLGRAIEEFPVSPNSIYEMVVAGNSTMRDLFFKLDVHSIGQSPYRSVTELDVAAGLRECTSLTANARSLRLPLNRHARVYGLPVISGHVGADAAACMLAVDLANEDRLVAVMDIGTNTELILGNRHKILAASCPAGPAFEGGKIACGMPGLPGAIQRVEIDDDGRFVVDVIGGGRPEGICGSGLVDLLGELLRTGRMNPLGRFENAGEPVLVAAGNDGPVCFNESDVNELAQAKGANVAGLRVVFDEYGARFDDVDVFYLAGGFGRYLNINSSKRIGLVPNLDNSKIVQVGNAAIEGACMALLSASRRRELEALVRNVIHCRLETHPRFFDYFVDGCQFSVVDTHPTLESALPRAEA